MTCKVCSKEIPNGSSFCPFCGASAYGTEDDLPPLDFSSSSDRGNNSSSEASQEVSTPSVKKKHTALWIVGLVVIAVAAYFLIFGSAKSNVLKSTKSMVFDQWTTLTLEQAANRTLQDPDWSIVHVEDNFYRVRIKGFSKEIEKNVQISFDVIDRDDTIYASLASITVNGETLSDNDSISFAAALLFDQLNQYYYWNYLLS